MEIVLREADWARLSAACRQEIIALLDAPVATAGLPPADSQIGDVANDGLRWRVPYDLNEEQARRLLHGLTVKQRTRLALFASRTGRVRMKEIMAVAGDADLKAASAFVKDMTRRLRRMITDPQKKAQLIQWDFDSTKWDAGRTTIVDGIYYVSPATAHALRKAFGTPGGREAA